MKKINKKWEVLFFTLLLVAAMGLIFLFVSRQKLPIWATELVFERTLFHERSELEKQTKSGDSNTYYFTSYYLHGMISALEANRSPRLLKKILHYTDNMVETAVITRYQGRDFMVWGPFNKTPSSPIPKPNVHFTLQAAVPLARVSAIIMRDPKFRAKYEDHAIRYTKFVKSAVFELWYETEYKNQVPWLNTEYVPIWNDNATNMGLCAIFMYEATHDPYYADIAKKVGRAFQEKLSPAGRGWIWESNTIPIGSDTDNTPGSVGNQAGVPDTSHTNRESMMMVFMHEAGLMYDVDDVQRMAFTFLDNIWNQSYSEPSFANYINGSNKPYRVYLDPGLNGPIYHGWALVGGYSSDAQRVLLRTLKAIVLRRKNPSLLRNASAYGGLLGLSGNILRNFAVQKRLRQAATQPVAPPVKGPPS